jgi:hypothetical protein
MPKELANATVLTAAFVRPSDTTTYTTGDVLCNSTTVPAVLTFDPVARENGGGGIIQAAIVIDSANVATKATLELWLFNVAPAAVNDNAAFAPSDTELTALIGVIPFPAANIFVGNAGAAAAGNCVEQSGTLDLPYKCAYNDRNLYGVLVVRSAYVPISAEAFNVNLSIVAN